MTASSSLTSSHGTLPPVASRGSVNCSPNTNASPGQPSRTPDIQGFPRSTTSTFAAADTAKTKVKRRKRKPFPIALNLSACKYEVVRMVQKKLGWKEVGDDDDWQVYWTDTSVSIERIMRLKRTQKINHFTGMLEICRKKSLARNIGKMAKLYPDEYKFVPKSYILPAELSDFLSEFKTKKKRTWILKPDSGCQGKGIVLAQDAETAMAALEDTENVVAQRYIAKPHLINGMKYDMRIYVLVVSCDPLRVFIYEEGLVRFCTEPYTAPSEHNLDQVCMHLTNYALNKHNDNFVFNEDSEADDSGSKWSLSGLREYMAANGEDFASCWSRIEQMVVKTLISAQPILQHNYRSVLPADNDGLSCFELLGMDVMLDHKLKPWLVEVNHSPSFTVDTPLDLAIKEELISDTIELVGIDPKLIKKMKTEDREEARNRLYNNAKVEIRLPPSEADIKEKQEQIMKQREAYEQKHMGAYLRIFPPPDQPELYKHYIQLIDGAQKAFRESIPHKVIDTIARTKAERERRSEGGSGTSTIGPPPTSAGSKGGSAPDASKALTWTQKRHSSADRPKSTSKQGAEGPTRDGTRTQLLPRTSSLHERVAALPNTIPKAPRGTATIAAPDSSEDSGKETPGLCRGGGMQHVKAVARQPSTRVPALVGGERAPDQQGRDETPPGPRSSDLESSEDSAPRAGPPFSSKDIERSGCGAVDPSPACGREKSGMTHQHSWERAQHLRAQLTGGGGAGPAADSEDWPPNVASFGAEAVAHRLRQEGLEPVIRPPTRERDRYRPISVGHALQLRGKPPPCPLGQPLGVYRTTPQPWNVATPAGVLGEAVPQLPRTPLPAADRMAPLSQVAPMHRDKMHVTGTHGSGTPVALPSRGPSRINLLEMPSSMLYEPIKGQQLRSHRRLSDPPTGCQESRRRSTGRTPC